MLEEPTIFITKASGCFDATRKRESFFSNHLFKPQASLSSIRTQTISCWIHGPELNECKARFIDSMDPFAQDAELCLRGVLKVVYRSRIHLVSHVKPGSIQEWVHLIIVFNVKFICTEVKVSLSKLAKL